MQPSLDILFFHFLCRLFNSSFFLIFLIKTPVVACQLASVAVMFFYDLKSTLSLPHSPFLSLSLLHSSFDPIKHLFKITNRCVQQKCLHKLSLRKQQQIKGKKCMKTRGREKNVLRMSKTEQKKKKKKSCWHISTYPLT